ncbi:Mo-dependent nitrogenase C-terminal domain-containing protein [Spirulina major]|uniref:Mo-dependent nitrogenase C-terminal domain-containing protein n=1 Tax=Spirulina major TaxID=270636 RepID=UPI0009330F00|nr:Mo-dependent nitrogenase C-terminal domain-containing protein [Spirulina major]
MLNSTHSLPSSHPRFAPLQPVRTWLQSMAIANATMARRLCTVIPNQCPFAREIRILGRKVAQIPPLCKLNPLYPELMELRFRALCYLADECNEDISAYC